ncbi:MAG TPA: sialidase family protein [Vicinamibacteria bacterium]|nr:sialidase family protein [Vicinamibacteria bacterium]
MKSAWAKALSLSFAVLAFMVAFGRVRSKPPSEFQIGEVAGTASVEAFAIDNYTASSGSTPEVHAATAVELSSGRIRAFWYGGTREGAKDVSIYTAVFEPETGIWSADEVLVSRTSAGRELGRYIRKLGNPMVTRDQKGRLWLFFVSVSVGGWSGSAINFKVSDDEGQSWSRARRLVTSPFLNLGTLVRGAAFLYRDGTMGVPVYHELIGKFGELLRLDPDGRIVSKTRLSWGRSLYQPVVVPLTSSDAVALFRQSHARLARVFSARSSNAGVSFTPPEPTKLANPDAGIFALRSGERHVLIAFNDSEVDRSNLKLALSKDSGRTFRIVYEVEPPATGDGEAPRLAYPWLVESRAGELHLLYTWDRTRIQHVRFRGAWRQVLER